MKTATRAGPSLNAPPHEEADARGASFCPPIQAPIAQPLTSRPLIEHTCEVILSFLTLDAHKEHLAKGNERQVVGPANRCCIPPSPKPQGSRRGAKESVTDDSRRMFAVSTKLLPTQAPGWPDAAPLLTGCLPEPGQAQLPSNSPSAPLPPAALPFPSPPQGEPQDWPNGQVDPPSKLGVSSRPLRTLPLQHPATRASEGWETRTHRLKSPRGLTATG
jgi:hypothetical protein